MWTQRELVLSPKPRGFHLITQELISQLPEISELRVGLVHLILQHTSASLFLNENADPSVRGDMERHFNFLVPEGAEHYKHLDEGLDDMPAHIKSGLLGVDLTLAVRSGSLALGTWQGIYLGEHRNNGGSRRVVATLNGEYTDS